METIKIQKDDDGKYFYKNNDKTYYLNALSKGWRIKANVDMSNMGLTELPDLSGVVITGDLDVSHNKLKSMQGAPQVQKFVICVDNPFENLDGVQGGCYGIFCDSNQISALQNSSEFVQSLAFVPAKNDREVTSYQLFTNYQAQVICPHQKRSLNEYFAKGREQ